MLPAAMLLAVALLGCGGIRPPLTCPAKGGAAWNELTSRHFVLQTDLAASEAREVLSRFEGLRATLAQVLPPAPVEPTERVEIVLFSRKKDYEELGSSARSTRAYFTTQLAADLEPQPVLVLQSELANEGVSTFLHELAHRFLRQRYADLPVWLNEGFAQFYSTLRVQEGTIRVGGRLRDLDFTELPYVWASWYEDTYQVQIPVMVAPSVRELIDADTSAFYRGSREDGLSGEEAKKRSAYYGAAWKLVQLLMYGPDAGARTRFQAFLAALEHGARAKSAFHEAFGEADLDRLEQLFHAYLTEVRLDVGVKPYHVPVAAPPDREVVMSDAEVHLLWARLRPWNQAMAAAVEQEIEEARLGDPSSPEIHFRRATFRLQRADFDGARRDLDFALAARPEEPRYLYGLLLWSRWRAQLSRASGAPPPPTDEIAGRLARFASSPMQLDSLASRYAALGRTSDAYAFAERAIALDPLCSACQDTYSLVLLQAGRLDQALAASRRALSLVPEDRPSAREITAHGKRIEEARAALRARTPAASPGP
ncbi:MAG: hypothetical protein ABJE95_20985 [Byssovorax sp.]